LGLAVSQGGPRPLPFGGAASRKEACELMREKTIVEPTLKEATS